jgi:preprotein translocase subunit SecD
MKTIFYLFIISLMAISLALPAQKSVTDSRTFILQATKNSSTEMLLKQSAKIISDRLKATGLSSFDIKVMPDKEQIIIRLTGADKPKDIEGLLVSGGKLALYETLTIKGISDIIKNDQAFSPTDCRVGCSTYENPDMVTRVESYLKSNNHPANYKLCWGLKSEKSGICLYALKTKDGGKPLLERSDIEKINSALEKDSPTYKIEIKFTKPSITLWAEATKNNLGRQIAIVIDEKVYDAPVVKAQINSGLCEITGDLTKEDVDYFLALVNNDPLPLSLKMVK